MHKDIEAYNNQSNEQDKAIFERLAALIDEELKEAESKIWHRQPVWFLAGNPTVGYIKQKDGIRLMFWSGADFDEPQLLPGTGKFKDASIFYIHCDEIDPNDVRRWLKKSREIQWDYKNLVKRKGVLEPLSGVSKK